MHPPKSGAGGYALPAIAQQPPRGTAGEPGTGPAGKVPTREPRDPLRQPSLGTGTLMPWECPGLTQPVLASARGPGQTRRPPSSGASAVRAAGAVSPAPPEPGAGGTPRGAAAPRGTSPAAPPGGGGHPGAAGRLQRGAARVPVSPPPGHGRPSRAPLAAGGAVPRGAAGAGRHGARLPPPLPFDVRAAQVPPAPQPAPAPALHAERGAARARPGALTPCLSRPEARGAHPAAPCPPGPS